MRTEYLRSAWQAYDDNAVRFSFDEHMLLLREGAVTRDVGSGWCSPLESLAQLPASDAVRFPYAILEVKLQDREASPAWVHELKTSGVLVEVPNFSKFLHGMALLKPEKIREVPSWFVWREAAGVTLPASLDEMWDMTAERRAQQEMDWQVRHWHQYVHYVRPVYWLSLQ
jgi:SPX domain protein involved in polyphosphate accumulation